MNLFLEPLPGLLDDPQFQIPDLPHLTDYQIAPLRDPAPSRSINAPSPLEPTAGNNVHARTTPASKHVPTKRKTPKISPAEILHARDTKKPNLAISELVESQKEEPHPVQLPSFISLAIVEKSPVPRTQSIDDFRPLKRPRLEVDVDTLPNDEYRHLPLPPQKDDKNAGRTKPLLPAMVTGLHEPPPTAALLPSMETEKLLSRSPRKASRLLLESPSNLSGRRVQGRPPEQMLNSPEITAMPLGLRDVSSTGPGEQEGADTKIPELKAKEAKPKSRRTPKKWTDEETDQLMLGVGKYGIGKWKQILADPAFRFEGRSSVDLKDRFRVRMPDAYRDRELVVDNRTSEVTAEQGQPAQPRDISVPAKSIGSPQEQPKTANRTLEKDPVQSTGPNTTSTPQNPSDQTQGETSKARRRKRRPWTSVEDNDLMRGVQRHGFQWTLIHDDPNLNLSHRKATDLRDRIRNMFPDGYKNAGTRPTPKKEQNEGSRTLPPLVLDEDGDWDWSNNTLPPLLEWEEIGM